MGKVSERIKFDGAQLMEHPWHRGDRLKKGLSGSCYIGNIVDCFIFRVPKSTVNDNIIVYPLSWHVRTVEFMNLSLKLSLPPQFP